MCADSASALRSLSTAVSFTGAISITSKKSSSAIFRAVSRIGPSPRITCGYIMKWTMPSLQKACQGLFIP